MDSSLSSPIAHSNIKALSTQPAFSPVTKNDATAPGGSAPDPQLAGWYEQAYAYYNAVMAGDPSTPKPDAQAWNDFLSQMQWAAGQLGYGAPTGMPWNPAMGGPMGPGGPMGQQGPQSNQFGGTTGTMDNWVYTSEKTTIGFTGDGTHDVWSNDFTLNIAPTSASVTVENTTDTRFQPNEPVVKITVTDPATGTQAVYFVHDYDATKDKIKINTPDSASQVVNNTGDTTSITTGKYTPGAAGSGEHKDASIEGVPQDDGTILYEPEFAGGTIDFWANPGESQTHVVYSDANISVKPSDNVNVTKGADGVLTVLVTHKDGTTDTYQIQKGYKANVNVNAEYITYGNPPVSSDTVPTDLADRVTVNGGTAADGSTDTGALNGDSVVSALLGMTSPARTEAQLLSALQAIYPGKYPDMAAFKKAITDGTFPGTPDNKLLDFLRLIDGDLNTKLNDLLTMVGSSDTDDKKKSATQAVQDRLVELLGALMPNDIVSSGTANKFEGSITIDGKAYNWTTWGSDDWVFK